jgi:hypothetical protein
MESGEREMESGERWKVERWKEGGRCQTNIVVFVCILEHCVRSDGSAIRRYSVLGCVAIVSALMVQRFLALVVHRVLRLCVVFVV